MRIYKFLSKKHALIDICERKVRISEIQDLNDPFELIPWDLTDPRRRTALIKSRDDMTRRGLLSFSLKWNDPLMWAHYAEKHQGICLGFDMKNVQTRMKRIRYIRKRLKFPRTLDERAACQMLFRKFVGWSYEKEVRVYASKVHVEKGGSFAYFKSNGIRLREIMLGYKCHIRARIISEAIRGYSNKVDVFRVRPAYDSFMMVRERIGNLRSEG